MIDHDVCRQQEAWVDDVSCNVECHSVCRIADVSNRLHLENMPGSYLCCVVVLDRLFRPVRETEEAIRER